MTKRFVVVYEANADFTTATELADRALCDAIDWLEEEFLEHHRTWLSQTSDGDQLTWQGMRQMAFDARVRAHGHFDGEPGEPDAAAARRAILFIRLKFSDVDAILLIRDQDDQPARRNGLEQARGENHGGIPIVLGFAIVKRECWVLCGYEPRDNHERFLLTSEAEALGFDPRLFSHGLTAKRNDELRSSKRILRQLSGGDWERERCCWSDTALATLRERGVQNGLTAYLKEVRERLAVLIGHPS